MHKSPFIKSITLVLITLVFLILFIFVVLPLENIILTILSGVMIVGMIIVLQLYHTFTLFKRDSEDQALNMRPCPHCANPIYKTDKQCPYCKKTFEE